MKKIIFVLVFAIALMFAVPSGTTAGPHKNHKHSSSKHSKGKKTVHVKGYTTKKGKHVHSYKRSKPHRK